MSEYEALRNDLDGIARGLEHYSDTAVRHLLEQSTQIDRLWADNAELRDELHALANRVETLTRARLTEPAEVAERIMNDANRSTLRLTTQAEDDVKITFTDESA